MIETLKNYAIAALLLLSICLFVGYEGVKKDSSKSTTVESKQIDQKVDSETKTVTVKEPNGTIETTTDTKTIEDTKTEDQTKTVVETKSASSKVNVSLLAGYDFTQDKKVYGVSVTKDVLGPISVGVFTINGVVGISAGLSF